jgi:S-(hydroxymethyl)glutathione dehydrogenase / alcohol dehydrogenase
MKAAVLAAPREAVSIENVELDDIHVGEVLVRIEASGVCHTDLEVIDGSAAVALPAVLGHEGAGVVEAVGAGVPNIKRGDRVVLSWNPSCGNCFYCIRGQPILCEPAGHAASAGTLMDGSRRLRWDGGRLNHFGFVSSHAEFAVAPWQSTIVVPSDLAADRGCLIGCGVTTGVGAALRIARVEAGSTVAVFGSGIVGLSAVAGARIAGARRIIAIDLNPARLAVAARFGATDVLVAGRDDVGATISRLTARRGCDYVFEAVGRAEVFRQAVEAARPGGKVVFLGKVAPDAEVSFRWGSLMGERQITRSSYGGARPARDFPYLAGLYLDGLLDLDALISSRHGLDAFNEALAEARAGTGIRAVITH